MKGLPGTKIGEASLGNTGIMNGRGSVTKNSKFFSVSSTVCAYSACSILNSLLIWVYKDFSTHLTKCPCFSLLAWKNVLDSCSHKPYKKLITKYAIQAGIYLAIRESVLA